MVFNFFYCCLVMEKIYILSCFYENTYKRSFLRSSSKWLLRHSGSRQWFWKVKSFSYPHHLQKLFEFSSIIAGVQNFCCLGKVGLNAGVYRIPGGDSGYSGRPDRRKNWKDTYFKKNLIFSTYFLFNFALYCNWRNLQFFLKHVES